jgi:hypothetical protein
LKELDIDPQRIRTREKDIRLRVERISEMIDQKNAIIDNVRKLVGDQRVYIEGIKPVDLKLRECDRDLKHLEDVIEIINGVALDAEALFDRNAESTGTAECSVGV